jgi:hypothetical protein
MPVEEKKYYKQVNIYENIDLNNRCISNHQIQAAVVDFKVETKKIIDTIEGTSLEGQVLTGKKLLIIGNLNTKIFIKVCSYHKNGFWIEKCIPFSTFIIIPKDICEEDPIHIKYTIEDITAMIITCGKLFVSITLLLEYQDEY